MVAGTLASAAMDLYWLLVKANPGDRPEQKPKGPGDGLKKQQPATQNVADEISEALTGREVPAESKAEAGVAVHYATGLLSGAIFGVAHARWPKLGIVAGLLYGVAIWAMINEGLLRVLNLAPSPKKVPAAEHVQALGAHLVFGASTALLTRLSLNALRKG